MPGKAPSRTASAKKTSRSRAKSNTRKPYALTKGWTVAEEHIYIDDGISGAEFGEKKRPGFFRLMSALKPKAPFQVLVMSEESRLGREAIDTAYALKQLITGGVRVFLYLEDRERKLESATDTVMLSITNYADAMEREGASVRTHDKMIDKARLAHVTGGQVYGYDNVDVFPPTPDASGRFKRLYVVRRVNDAQAIIVRRIFELCAAGHGFTTIAKTLNAEGALPPRAGRGRIRAWAGSAVRVVLNNDLYRGLIIWNRSKKRNTWGVKQPRKRPEAEWIRVEAPDLRILTETQWAAAHERLAATRTSYLRATNGRLWGRPASGLESKYLLTGLAQCAQCGRSLYVRSRSHGRERAFFYGCTTYNLRGRTACTNALEMPMETANAQVLRTLQEDILHPAVLAESIRKAILRLRPTEHSLSDQWHSFLEEHTAVDAEIACLTAAIAAGGDLPSLLSALKDRERRRTHLHERIASLECLGTLSLLDTTRLERDLETALRDWQGLLTRHVAQTRQLLRKLLAGRLRFTPILDGASRRYEFTGQAAVGRLLTGLVFTKHLVSPTGLGIRGAADPFAFTEEILVRAA